MEIVFQGIEFHMAWWALGSGWGKMENLLLDAPGSQGLPFMTGLVTFLVHACYSWRIFALGKRYAPAVVVVLLSAVQLAYAAYITAYGSQIVAH